MKITRRSFLQATLALGLQTGLAGLTRTDLSLPVRADEPYNVLTGEEGATATRIVGVMVNNIANSSYQNARPQCGLSEAKLLIEAKVEGGITRFCALYDDVDAIPEVGPIRSGRDQFLQLIMPWQALYYHDGESMFCTQFVSVYDYSGYNIGGKSYFNTPVHPQVAHRNDRGMKVAYEHTEFISAAEIRSAVQKAGISMEQSYRDTFFSFYHPETTGFFDAFLSKPEPMEGCAEAPYLYAYYSDHYRTGFVWNADTAHYTMFQYSRAEGKNIRSTDYNNHADLTFENVVLCFAEMAAYPGDSGDVQNVEFVKSGNAYVFSKGKVKPCIWRKAMPTEPLTLWDEEGNPVQLTVGKTYLGLIDTDEAGRLVYGGEPFEGAAQG